VRLRMGVALALAATATLPLNGRKLVATDAIEAPKEFLQLAAHSRGTGAIYVHPYMKWNSMSGVLMIAIAKDLGRPIVNGYLGIAPPWFDYASRVLHRFPDPEAVWLLRRWKVETVVSLAARGRAEQPDGLERVFENAAGQEIWEMTAAKGDARHPSEADARPVGSARVDGTWSGIPPGRSGFFTVEGPSGFLVRAVEIHFEPSVVERVPAEVVVYAAGDAPRTRLNLGRSGLWIASLAADALLRRKAPIATVVLASAARGPLLLECRTSTAPPIGRIVLIGDHAQ
jgi:hypothetical protein